jgi:hypothetical protein
MALKPFIGYYSRCVNSNGTTVYAEALWGHFVSHEPGEVTGMTHEIETIMGPEVLSRSLGYTHEIRLCTKSESADACPQTL